MEELIEKLINDTSLSRDKCIVIAIESALSGKTVWEVAEMLGFAQVQSAGKNELATSDGLFDLDKFVPNPHCLALLSEKCAKQYRVLPIQFSREQNVLTVAHGRALGVLDRDRIQREVGEQIRVDFCKVSSADLNQALDKSYGVSHALDDIISEIAAGFVTQRENKDTELQIQQHKAVEIQAIAETGPIVRLVDALLHDSVSRGASDIHLSPEVYFVRIQYRIDGTLTDACVLHVAYWSAILVRVKVMSGMDISETRLPQDSHITRTINGRQVDYRVASFPLVTGENIVLRVLDRQRKFQSIEGVTGDSALALDLLRMVRQPSGLVLVCGPTGSGKTTTLYAMLASLDATALNIMTLEDPVEYPIAGIRQTTIQPAMKMDFAEGLRGVLRQDPDVLLVGEIRDKATCAMTCRAAMTGHLVLTSLHAPDCLRAIARLIDLGAERSVLSATLCGVVAQRLVRKICTGCDGDDASCLNCFGSGYYGRMALIEYLAVTPEFADLLQSSSSASQLKNQAERDGFLSLSEKAVAAVTNGLTTRQEIERVFGTAKPGVFGSTESSTSTDNSEKCAVTDSENNDQKN